MTTPKLSAFEVSIAFGGVHAVEAVSVSVEPGEVVGLMGPNGAGKTTLMEMLSGYLTPRSGSVCLDGEDITRLSVHERARRGIARGFQDARMFPSMTVEEVLGVSLDRHVADRVDLAGMLFGLPSSRRAERWVRTRVDELTDRFGLAGYRDAPIAELSTGTRRVVEIAAVMGSEPSVVLLDEPSAGIAQAETDALRRILRGIQRDTAVTVVLVEHDVPMLMDLSHRIYVMDAGRMLAEGTPAEIARDPDVLEAYFGVRPPEISAARAGDAGPAPHDRE